MSDDEFDKDFKPSGRPQSTMAISFSLALNDLFKIDNCVADLDAVVSEKKKAVNTQTSELEALEARLKATEERLKKAASGSPPPKSTGHTNSSTSPKHETRVKNTSRPQTKDGNKEAGHSAPPVPGALPPTPGASEGTCSDSEYVLVKRVDK